MTRILVAEDDSSIAKYLATIVQKMGMEVDVVGDGQSALDSIARKKPSLLCLDLNLPVVSGFDVFRQLRSQPDTADLPVVIASARSGLDVESEMQELGASVFLHKPIRPKVFMETIKGVLELASQTEAENQIHLMPSSHQQSQQSQSQQ